MYAVTPLEPAPVCLSFKASPEKFAELTERQNIIPAPYLARAQWVALQTRDAVTHEELARLLRESYEMILARLPKNLQEAIASGGNTGHSGQTARGGRKKGGKKSQARKNGRRKR